MSKIVFKEKGHTYTQDDIPYRSVTGIVGMFEPKMDVEYWSKYKAYEALILNFSEIKSKFKGSQNPKLFEFCQLIVDDEDLELKQQEIKDMWRRDNKAAIDRGNRYHIARENRSLKNGYELNPFTGHEHVVKPRVEKVEGADNYSIHRDLYKLEDGYYPELLIFNEELRIAGQSDRVFIETIDNIRYVDVDDYKTNKKITTENRWQNLLPPLDHIPDSKFHKYELQVSFYAWMLEQFGFVVRNTAFHHFNLKYDTEYKDEEIETIVEFLRNGKNLT